ncbi:uncharacterized protein LOC109716583 isoform X3 [Ananas comosus]|uniref:Uncharacterized protein LOC109716583 isoform X3 n=1 Tax=Ananas comosus TaxID=4615 RepID=A0A6P5FN57_ANACO|nr:uncharacterized protein LOC109716583 isoform X3 [Ananas comosus]
MATMATTVICPQIQFGRTHIIPLQKMVLASTKILDSSITTFSSWERPNQRLLLSSGRKLRDLSLTTFAVGSGLEASITDQKKKNDISLDNVKVAVESRDDEKIHVRVDLTAEETQKAFDEVLTNLARTAPPIPGFRRMKGDPRASLSCFCMIAGQPKEKHPMCQRAFYYRSLAKTALLSSLSKRLLVQP